MKKRTVKIDKIIYDKENVTITKDTNELFFEIGNKVTNDIAEAVAIMMMSKAKEGWDVQIDSSVEIDPERCLYWLSGGEKEWRTLEHYNTPWINCYLDFQEEFGFLIVDIIRNSKTLGDIKKQFTKHLNLPTLYDFALSKDLVK